MKLHSPQVGSREGRSNLPLGRAKNPHDIFINLDGSIGSCLSKIAYKERRRKNTGRTSTSH